MRKNTHTHKQIRPNKFMKKERKRNHNIAAAKASDRELEDFLAQIWVAGGGGAAPPHPPYIPGGSAPRTPQKRRSAPLPAAVVRSLATASLPGAEIRLSFEHVTCPWQLRCLEQNFFSKIGLLV